MIKSVLDKILGDNENVDKLINDFYEEIRIRREVELKYIKRYRNLPVKERLEIFEKIQNKYKSNEYRDREYFKCGCEPREYLFNLYLSYAEDYGDPLDIPEDDKHYFTTGMWILKEENLIVERLDGQGTVIKVYKPNGSN